MTADALSRFDLNKFKSDVGDVMMDNDPTDCTNALNLIISKCFT